MRKFLAGAALSGLALVLALGAAEIAARVFFQDTNVLYPRYHTDYRYGPYTLRGIRPNAEFWHTSIDGHWRFVTDSRGFRDERDFPYAKPAGTLRILALGDSHTQGYEVRQESTFSAVAERSLRARGLSAEVLNAGVSGFGTAEELAFLENEGYKYRPDVVVLGFYANDFEDNVKAGLFALDAEGRLVEKKHEHIPGARIQNVIYAVPGVRWLGEHSYFYSLLFNGVWEAAKAALARTAVHEAGADAPPVPATEYAVPTHANISPKEVMLAAALMERMQRFCAERSIRLIVIDIPARSGPRRFVSSLPGALLERLKRAGVEVVPSTELLAPYDGVVEMHVPHGHQHISEFTHALIGMEVAKRAAAALPAGVRPVEPVAAVPNG